ncbi:hypothetical protein VNO77_37042 [Canavalia gladiata]|uniref:RING-type E3 ubiquitin transferase n=1 Tax=Canavalia gladiata TaxID=3824 RepID=A0AAN9K8J8_CANGL
MDNDYDPNDFNKFIFFTSIFSFVIVVFFVVALCLYARCILMRQSRRRSFIHQLTLSALHASDAQQNRFAQFEPSNTGLDSAIIASLPTFTVLPKILESIDCPVCLSPLQGGETAKLLPACKHFFHAPCIDTWLRSHATCPLCRTRVDQLRLEPHNREAPFGLTPNAVSRLALEGTSSNGDDGLCVFCKNSGSISRLNSFTRIITGMERSSRRIQSSSHVCDYAYQDLERQ